MELSEKPKTFCRFYVAFLESTLNFEHFELKKKEPHSLSISCLLKCIKGLVSENLLAVNVLQNLQMFCPLSMIV